MSTFTSQLFESLRQVSSPPRTLNQQLTFTFGPGPELAAVSPAAGSGSYSIPPSPYDGGRGGPSSLYMEQQVQPPSYQPSYQQSYQQPYQPQPQATQPAQQPLALALAPAPSSRGTASPYRGETYQGHPTSPGSELATVPQELEEARAVIAYQRSQLAAQRARTQALEEQLAIVRVCVGGGVILCPPPRPPTPFLTPCPPTPLRSTNSGPAV